MKDDSVRDSRDLTRDVLSYKMANGRDIYLMCNERYDWEQWHPETYAQLKVGIIDVMILDLIVERNSEPVK
jgi:hypothetical protein